ncbi:hypothetical protein D1007_21846 [Hordeum vulgare]|nr:hypothetical protein D1007_21846 [Hordeum vulgare]
MAETVVSMARSMVRGAISVAASAAAAEVGLLVGVQKDIWFIKDELETIQAFLEIAETIKKKDVLLKVWAKQTEASNTIDSADSYTEDIRNLSASNIDEADLVGFSKPKGELIELMDVNTKDGFAKVAFVVVSQTFSKIEMLKDMIMQLFGNEELKKRLKQLEGKTVQVDDLATYLRKKLEDKRYFIVLDDVWSIDAWRWIKVNVDGRADVTAELHMACAGCFSRTNGVRVPAGIGNLKELQILEVVDIKQTDNKAVKELGKLTQLRKLSVVTGRFAKQKQKMLHLCSAIEKLPSLHSLSVEARYGGTLEWLHNVSSPPPLLKNLMLCGCLGENMSEWFGSLNHLVKIYLDGSCLKEDKITEMLGELPKLMLLSLESEAHAGEKLLFREESFQNLRKLCIAYPGELMEVRFKKGASPRMEMLELSYGDLESGIIGINHLPMLKQVSLGKKGRVANLGMLQAEVDAHPNNPMLQLKQDCSQHDLGDVFQGFDVVETEECSSQATNLRTFSTLDKLEQLMMQHDLYMVHCLIAEKTMKVAS